MQSDMTVQKLNSLSKAKIRKLNLGCGDFPMEGFINVDIASPKADLCLDLNILPLPFENNQFDLIVINHVLEHLIDPFRTMGELHRLLSPGGRLEVRVPHFSRGFTHPDHKRGFDITFPFYFNRNLARGQFFQGTELNCVSTKFNWYAQPYLKKEMISPPVHYFLMGVGKVLNVVAGISPAACSRIWCFWVGGFEEVEFIFLKPKENNA